ncbi:type III secretion system inner membrane ring lipoprotein SctJ [Erwinia piriflorinigrans]|uniref:Lipoprotein n=1 Tax=Erwinia piriflorinigrans CFBP 5888 TaxID=1161919 RepID=V5Z7Y5_9GAMM|nr:type III secretion inner membrane ring lipoprotein SctJ [Erwinia piriflorinigrans]CCG87059.1 Lipoprotein prgK [Erwinia piriflorinigrans CFBP 5888]
MLKKKKLPAFITIMTFMLSACDNEMLLENLTQEQANQVLTILHQHNIPANKNGTLKSGYTIRVDEKENTAALSIINQYQLPWSADVQIGQAFPDSALIASPNAERVRILSLIEQRLEQSLRTIAQVVSARVHISYPSFKSEVVNKTLTNHVGILISYNGDIDQSLFIPRVKSLIKNSLDDIKYENISVVLFDTPPIQYTPPIKISHSLSTQWLISLTAIIILVIAALLYSFRRYYRRFKVEDVKQESLHKKQESAKNVS